MLKVLHIGKYYPPFHGGIENFLCDLAECQLEQGDVEPSVLVHQHEVGRAEETETANGVFVRRVRIIGRAVFTPLSPLFLRSLNRTIEERNPDILHLHLPNPSTFWCLFSKSARKRPWIIHWHSDVLGGAPNWRVKLAYPFYRIFEWALLQRAHCIIATSPPYLETSHPLQAHREKCIVIPLGIRSARYGDEKVKSQAIETLAPGQSKSGKTVNSELKLIAVGRLTYYKGHEYLIRAVAELPNTHLFIVGVGDRSEAISNEIKALNLESRVILLGDLAEEALRHLMRNSDLLCLTSTERTEAFGLVILEAALAGKPALVTDVTGSGMSWVVDHNLTGWVVPPADVEAIKRCLQWIDLNRSSVKLAGQVAHEKFESRFCIDHVSKEVLSAYGELRVSSKHRVLP